MNLTKNQKEIINDRLNICDEMVFVAMDDLRRWSEWLDCCKFIRKRADTLIDKLITNAELDDIELCMVKDIYYYARPLNKKGSESSHRYLQVKLEKFLTDNKIEYVHPSEAPDYDYHGIPLKLIKGGRYYAKD